MAKGLGPRRKIGKKFTINRSRNATPVTVPWIRHRNGGRRDENNIEISADVQIYVSYWFDGPQMTDFVFVLKYKVGNRWKEIAKVDCCHDAVHIHEYNRKSQETSRDLQVIAAPSDLRLGCEQAENLIFNQIESHIRRWSRGR